MQKQILMSIISGIGNNAYPDFNEAAEFRR